MMRSYLFPITIFALFITIHVVFAEGKGGSEADKSERLKAKVLSSQLVPEVIDTAPGICIRVRYENDLTILPGKVVTPSQVRNNPVNMSWPVEDGALYTLLMVDPDAPSRTAPLFRNILHWLQVNISGNNLTSGEILVPYRGSGAPQDTGLHRYVFMVFKQPSALAVDSKIGENRVKFDTKKFIQEYSLPQPLAINWFEAEFDEYVRGVRNKRVMDAFKRESVNDIIAAPQHFLDIHYPSGLMIPAGAVLTPTEVRQQPQKLVFKTEPETLYTLAMVDPDAPSRKNPTNGEFLHWLVVNMNGTDVASGDTYSEYIGSGAPRGTGLHRYIFLAFKQPGRVTLTRPRVSNRSAEMRRNFKIADFAKENNLGSPVAGTFFMAEYDDSVDELHRQLKGGR